MNCSLVSESTGKTSESTDRTNDPVWLNQQADRFLAFEMLYHVVHASYNEVVPSALADKLGLNYKLVSTMIRQIGRRETTSQLKQRFNEYNL